MKTRFPAFILCLISIFIPALPVFALDNLSTEQEIQQLYLAYLGRPANLAGIQYWAGQVDAQLITLEEIRVNFVNEQPEYLENYGQLGNLDLTETVYLNLFNRESGLDGRDYWVNQLEQNLLLPDQLIIAFVNAASEPDQVVLQNKLFVAECQTNGTFAYTEETLSKALASVSSSVVLTSCPTGSDEKGATFSVAEITEINGSGGIAGDSNGVTITVEADAVPGGDSVRLMASSAEGELIEEFSQYYQPQSLFYSADVEGDEDAPGRVLLQFPAEDSDLRLAVISDGRHFSVLPFTPVDGKLNVRVPLTSEIAPEDAGLGVRTDDHLQVVVVRPGSQSISSFNSGKFNKDGKDSPSFTIASNHVTCTNDGPFNWCVNDAGTIQVAWSSNDYSVSDETAGVIITEVQRALDAYLAAGITNAEVSSWSWVNVVLEGGRSNGAEFSSNTGNIYIGNDSIITTDDGNGNLRLATKARQNLWHELFHFIQDFSYNMKFSRLFQDRSWWIEVTAEYAPSLVDPALLGESARIGGSSTLVDGGPFGIQMAPFLWEAGSAGYIHAQLLAVNTCDNAFYCAQSVESFASAINAGSFPFRSVVNQNELLGSTQMADYMRYLLGASPLNTNTTIPLPDNIANGTSIGDAIYARQNKVGSGNFNLYPVERYFTPRVTRTSDSRIDIAATMGPGAAYHARISNDNKPPNFQSARSGVLSWPLSLTLPVSSTPVSYRTGTTDSRGVTTYGNVLTHDGSSELVIAPINQALGISVVRIAANNNQTSGNKTLNATVELVDLSGYWEHSLTAVTGDTVQCLDTTVVIPERSQLLADFLTYSGSTGVYEQQAEPDNNMLTYTTNVTLPENTTISADATIQNESIASNHSISFSDHIINNIQYDNATLSTAFNYTSLTHNGTSDGTPLWTLAGSGTTTFNVDIQGRNDQGVNTLTTCTGEIAFTSTGNIYAAVPDSSAGFPGDEVEGSFTITFYSNFDGSIGFDSPIDPSFPDIKISGSGERPVISWSEPLAVAVVLAGGSFQQILYQVVATDDDEDVFQYLQPPLTYGDYSREFTVANPQASNPSPNLLDDGAEYVITLNTGNAARPVAVLGFRVNPPE